MTKKLRSTLRQRPSPPSMDTHQLKPSKSTGTIHAPVPTAGLKLPEEDRSKSSKARARPVLTIANSF